MMTIAALLLFGAWHNIVQIGWIWLVLVPLEILLPKRGQVSAYRRLKGFVLGLISWSAMGVTGMMVILLFQRLGIHPLLAAHIEQSKGLGLVLWPIAGAAVSFLAYDFFYYWFHRAQHSRLLWRFHAVHHAIEDLNAANYLHWTEELTRLPFMTLPMALLMPADLPVAFWAAGLTTLQSMYIHSPTRLHFGPFWRIVYDNRFHRIHHSVQPHHFDKNFGVITPLWDWMFGTLYVPKNGEWPETGLADHPEVNGVWDYLWRPFRQRIENVEIAMPPPEKSA